MIDNHKDGANTHGNIGKLVQIGKMKGDITIQDTLETKTCCPVCERNDWSQKVSAAYRSLASHEKLHPPVKPKPESISVWWYFMPFLSFLGTIIAIFLSPINKKNKYMIGGIAAVILLAIGLYFLLERILYEILGQNTLWEIERAIGNYHLDALVVILYGFMLITFLIVYYVGLYREYQKRIAESREQTPVWEKAIQKWDVLYYCSRDDCVFDPQTNIHVSVNRIDELLYDQK